MRTLLAAILLILVWTGSAHAQPPPVTPYPIEGRIVRFGYDLDYPTICGDLIGIAGGTGSKDNGVLYGLPSLEVVYDVTFKVWRARVYTCAGWSLPTTLPSLHTGYYPTDGFTHTWLSRQPLPSEVLDLMNGATMGVLRCHGYDGVGVVPGDLQPGSHNGVLLALWARDVHLLFGDLLHARIYLGPTYGWKEVVYSKDLCDYDNI